LPILQAKGQSISPNIISPSGTYGSSSNGSLLWTLGDLITATDSTSDLIITSGFVQTFDESGDTTSIIEDINKLELKLYPNPTSDFIKIDNQQNLKLSVEIYSNLGKLLYSNELNTANNRIDLSNYSKGIYYLKLLENDTKRYNSYKLQKIR